MNESAEIPKGEPPLEGPKPNPFEIKAEPPATPSQSFNPEQNIIGDTTPYFTPSFTPEPNITGDTAFYYASPIPTPTPESQSIGTTEPQGGITPPSAAELTQVMISNYADFRFYNDPDDQGDSTISISNPNDPQNLEWIAKTMGPEKRMYVREIYSDGTYRDFEYTITHNDQRSSVSNIQILIKIVKKVARITIGDLDLEIDVKNPQVPLDFHLPGTEGQSQQFKIPVVITYSDGSTLHTALTFNYNPPNLPNPVPSPVSQTCTYSENFECTGKNAGCGGGSGEMKKTIINSDCSEKFETYCDSACASSEGEGNAGTCNLTREYNECGNDGGCFGVEQAGRVYRVQQFQGEGCSQEYACEEVDNCSAQGLQCEGDRCVSGGSGDNQTSECEDVYYCDNGTTIHKHGYHDGNECQYTWDNLEEPC